jgi:hypothetical protein
MRFGWCETEAGNTDYVLSGLMQQPKGTSNQAYEAAFAAAIGTDRRINCWFYYSTPTEAKGKFEQRQYVIRTEEKKPFRLSGWVGPYGIAGQPAVKPSGVNLTVESAGQKQAADQLRDAVLRAQRDEAAQRAKAIANTARQRADMQAKLDKFFEEMRKRGRAQ